MTDQTDKLLHTGGSLVFWDLASETPIKQLRYDWYQRSFGTALEPYELPDDPSNEDALRRAVNALRGRKVLPRQLPSRKTWVLKSEQISDDRQDVDFKTELRVELMPSGALRFSPDSHKQATLVSKAYLDALKSFAPEDLRDFLSRILYALRALRIHHGLYFVTTDRMPLWQTVADVLSGAASKTRFHKINPILDPDASEAVFAAVLRDADDLINQVDQILEDGVVGSRGLSSKVDEIDREYKRLQRHLRAIQMTAPDLEQKFEAIKARATVAAMRRD